MPQQRLGGVFLRHIFVALETYGFRIRAAKTA
jgi:hypothetical protein